MIFFRQFFRCFTVVACVANLLFMMETTLRAGTIFIEAEAFETSSSGWVVTSNGQTRKASQVKTLWGANGPGDAVATRKLSIGEAGRYRIWVRYLQVGAWRGPFRLAVSTSGQEVASQSFDLEPDSQVADWNYTWKSLTADLPAGEVTLTLSKHEEKNSSGYVRHVDCVLVTSDMSLVPDHVPFGPQTMVRVTLGEGYDRPAYIHLFADHYRDPWYAHFALGRDGIHAALAPPNDQKLKAGESTPWCNLTPTIYQDSGAALNFSVRHTYHERASHLRAKFEFGRKASQSNEEVEIIKTFDINASPNGVVIISPPDLETDENIDWLRRDLDIAEEVGRVADQFHWPTHGKRPERLPFLVSANIGGFDLPVDAAVSRREHKTLDYFGFNGGHERTIGGLWHMHGGSYCRPDLEAMRRYAKHELELFKKAGRSLDDIAVCVLMDEPTGQSASFAATDAGYQEKFREWLQAKQLTPAGLLVENWDQVRPVAETQADRFPALHYYTQLFRTRALGDFMAEQRQVIEEEYGRSFPTVVNFSDGAVYSGNFYGQGVDYFELLDDDRQNAIWGEDWANNASTYQCAAFNVDLMRAAARKRQQTIGHYLIAHARRTGWDTKTKATSETARGVRVWMNFSYGPSWGSHEGGPPSRSHLWYAKPEVWSANAEITREIGAVEDWLLTAQQPRAETAILYSSSSDIWTNGNNLAYGFDRMHTWLALAHAQTPVDIVSERDIAEDRLAQYKVCYLTGPNLTQAAAAKLGAWVEAGGVLWLTAGAAQRDEFNRPLDTLDSLLPAKRGELQTPNAYQSAGRFLNYLPANDTVNWRDGRMEVLSVKQSLDVRDNSEVLATFSDGQPAAVVGRAKQGRVYVLGFLPGLSYIKPAVTHRFELERAIEKDSANHPALATADRQLLERSYNPWQFPDAVRDFLLVPVNETSSLPQLTCDTPLIDAVALPCEQGVLIALANYTLRPCERVKLQLRVKSPISRIESVRHGVMEHKVLESGVVEWAMPLDANDFVKVWN